MNDMNKKLSALLLSGILGAMALPAFADNDTDTPGSPGPTTPSTPMNPGDDDDGIPPVQDRAPMAVRVMRAVATMEPVKAPAPVLVLVLVRATDGS